MLAAEQDADEAESEQQEGDRERDHPDGHPAGADAIAVAANELEAHDRHPQRASPRRHRAPEVQEDPHEEDDPAEQTADVGGVVVLACHQLDQPEETRRHDREESRHEECVDRVRNEARDRARIVPDQLRLRLRVLPPRHWEAMRRGGPPDAVPGGRRRTRSTHRFTN